MLVDHSSESRVGHMIRTPGYRDGTEQISLSDVYIGDIHSTDTYSMYEFTCPDFCMSLDVR